MVVGNSRDALVLVLRYTSIVIVEVLRAQVHAGFLEVAGQRGGRAVNQKLKNKAIDSLPQCCRGRQRDQLLQGFGGAQGRHRSATGWGGSPGRRWPL